MATHDIITVGASAGGIETLKRFVALLPADFPATILVAQHLHPNSPALLAGILSRAGKLPVRFATDGEAIAPGRIFIAPVDQHMLVEPGRLRVVRGPKENRHRPAIDPLFRSAAWAYGPRVIGIVLSGTLDDGAAGLWAIQSSGGVTIVQDPKDALYAEMPTSALMTLNVDHCLPLDGIPALLEKLVREPVVAAKSEARSDTMSQEIQAVTREHDTDVEDMHRLGRPVGFTCPACHGGLWELQDGELVRYRCHTGHAFSPDSLLAAQTEDIEYALDSALRALEEKGAAARRLEERMEKTAPSIAARYARQAAGLDDQAAAVRKLLHMGSPADG